MKKLFYTMAFLCGLAFLVSCNDDSHAKAECSYLVQTDSIVYTDTVDLVYDSLVHASLRSLQHTGYIFSESAEVDQSYISFAIAKCDEQAITQLQSNLKKSFTLSDVKNEMYKSNSDMFAEQGITNAANIPLHTFTVYLSLINFSNDTSLGYGTMTAK